MAEQSLQQECRRRAAKKLAATLLYPDFTFPTSLSAEQATGDELAEIHASLIPTGVKVVDLTCGLGIDAFHLARKASKVVAIDIDPVVAKVIEPNAKVLGLTNVQGVNADCYSWLENTDEKFDIAFIDPARRGANGQRLYSLHDCSPDIVELLPSIKKIAPRIIVKMSPMLDIDAVIRELPETQRLHILGTQGECKELVADVIEGFSGEPEIVIHTAGNSPISFKRSNLDSARLFTDHVRVGDIIGEPWPTVMKAAPWSLLSGSQLHPDSHLWLNPQADFPGKLYRVERIEDFSSSNIKRLAKERLSASVAVKNLPIKAAELSKRLKVCESDSRRLIATTLANGKRIMLFLVH